MSRDPERVRFIPWFLAAIFILPGLVAGGLAVWRPEDGCVTMTLGLCGLGVLGFLLGRFAKTKVQGSLVAMALFGALLVWPEIGLRAYGFQWDRTGVIQFGYPRPDRMIKLQRDPDLFWKLPPGLPGINSLGYVGDEFEITKPEGTFRIVFFGDSCTFQGYPTGVEQLLSRHSFDPRRFEAINLAVGGYSSHQGRILAERWSSRLSPDVGVIYFGWNDHWQAYGARDSQKKPQGFQKGMAWIMDQSRLLQWGASLVASGEVSPREWPRVTLEEYRANLLSMGERISAAGSQVLMMTAASAHRKRGAPPHLMEKGFAANPENVIEWHQQYNDVVRDVAQQKGWFLLDLESEVQEHPEFERIFKEDGIHFTDPGLRWVAGRVAQTIRSQWVLR